MMVVFFDNHPFHMDACLRSAKKRASERQPTAVFQASNGFDSASGVQGQIVFVLSYWRILQKLSFCEFFLVLQVIASQLVN